MNLKGFLKQHQEKFILLFVFFLVLFSRLYFLGSSLWHDDAFNFVDKALELAIAGDYNNAHSTGYPLWLILLVLLMKIGHLISGTWSIIFLPNLLSAIFGSLLIFPIYNLTKRISSSQKAATLAVLVVLANPVIWRWSEVAMSDVFSLLLALTSLDLFMAYIEQQKISRLILSSLFFYFALMIRPLYVLLMVVFLFFCFKNKKDLSHRYHPFVFFIISLILALFSYFLINNFSLAILLGNYGSRWPSVLDIFGTLWIILKSVAIFSWPLIVGGFYYLYRNNKNYFYLFLFFVLIFTLYLSSWYKNGLFDIERYTMIITVILLVVSVLALKINNFWRWSFAVLYVTSFVLTVSGLSKPVNFYKTYATDKNIFADYRLKASQVSQQKLVDGDLQTYSDLAEILSDSDVVFYWKNDWAIPSLLLAGAHQEYPAKLIAIDSPGSLKDKLADYSGLRVYLLRGVSDTYQVMAEPKAQLQNLILKERSIVYFID